MTEEHLRTVFRILINQKKPLLQLDLNKQLVKEWEAMSYASEDLKLVRTDLIKAIRAFTPYKGNYWKYKFNYEKMEKAINLIGTKVEHLTITSKGIDRDASGNTYLQYVCSCGVTGSVLVKEILNRRVISCGHTRGTNRRKDYSTYVGTQHGNLTLIKYLGQRQKQGSMKPKEVFMARCGCGEEFEISWHYLNMGREECAKCSNKYVKEADSHIGEIFERLTITSHTRVKSFRGKFGYLYKCKCSCGKDLERALPYADLVSGHTRSCGCLMREVSSINATKRALNNFVSDTPWYFYQNGKMVRCKSSYEVLLGSYLDFKNIDFEYEGKTFICKDKNRYTPDFYIREGNYYIEVKGYDNNQYQKEKIAELSATVDIRVFFYEDIVTFIGLPILTIDAYKKRADKLGEKQEDYLALLFIKELWQHE